MIIRKLSFQQLFIIQEQNTINTTTLSPDEFLEHLYIEIQPHLNRQ